MSPYLLAQVYMLALGLSAHATPVQDVPGRAFVLTARNSRLARSDRNGNVTTTVSNITDGGVFNAPIATREANKVMVKYANAQNVLDGVDLHPDTHPEQGYGKFNPPNLLTANTQEAASEDPSLREQAAEIIEVPPFAAGPRTAQMSLKDDISGELDVLYYGPMDFGDSKMTMDIDIDTGSADLWVPVDCRGCQNPSYVPSAKSSYVGSKQKCKVVYGTGQVSGTVAQDVVTISGSAATIQNQTFCAVHKVSDDLDQEPISGILGLAFGSISACGKPTFFENLLTEKKLAASIFSVHLTRGKESGSQVCFGCYDATKTTGGPRALQWNPVLSRTYWSIAMDGLAVNDAQTSPARLIAAIDTGTSLIYVPKDVASNFYALIPGSEVTMEYGPGFYTFPCDAKLSVSLSLGGKLYGIQPSDFNLGRVDEDSPNCVGGILAMGDGFPVDLAIVGDEFLKSWYSVFDYSGRVGFAPSINNQ
ncbi:aspartic peptidase domain-containing protein [Trametes meyenii]|nr:aspartic peptidase domain-containing protein [Trametes meyenii]